MYVLTSQEGGQTVGKKKTTTRRHGTGVKSDYTAWENAREDALLHIEALAVVRAKGLRLEGESLSGRWKEKKKKKKKGSGAGRHRPGQKVVADQNADAVLGRGIPYEHLMRSLGGGQRFP